MKVICLTFRSGSNTHSWLLWDTPGEGSCLWDRAFVASLTGGSYWKVIQHFLTLQPPNPLTLLSILLHAQKACDGICLFVHGPGTQVSSQVSHRKGKGRHRNQMIHITYGEKMSLGMPWTLRYHGEQFVARLMDVVKGLSTELMLCWKWMEKSGLRISCCEPCCEAACEMLLWQAQSIGHHYQPFTQLIRERSWVIFTLIPKDILGLLHTLPHSIAIYTPRSPRSYKHIQTQSLFVPALFL